EVDNPLPTLAKLPAEPQVPGPAELRLLRELQVVVQQLRDPALVLPASVGDGAGFVQQRGSRAHDAPRACPGREGIAVRNRRNVLILRRWTRKRQRLSERLAEDGAKQPAEGMSILTGIAGPPSFSPYTARDGRQ